MPTSFSAAIPSGSGKPVPRGVPRVLLGAGQPPVANHRRERPPRTRRLAGTARQSPDGPRHGQPDLAAPFRRGAGPHAQRLRRTRRAAGEPRVARLAGRAVRGVGLVGQGDAPAHHAVVGLSAEQPRRRPRRSPATRRTACFGRMNRRRLDAEAIRDSLLAVAGRLDATSRAGPAFADLAVPRRTLYLLSVRTGPELVRLRPPVRSRRPRLDRRRARRVGRGPAGPLLPERPVRERDRPGPWPRGSRARSPGRSRPASAGSTPSPWAGRPRRPRSNSACELLAADGRRRSRGNDIAS